MIKHLSLCSAALLTFASAEEMNPLKVLNLSVANKGHTRISVAGDAIQDVFARPVGVKDHLELHKSGHLLIVGDGLKETTYVTLFTRKGLPQDLVITPMSKDPTPIVLDTATLKSSAMTEDEVVAETLSEFSQGRPSADFIKDHSVSALRPFEGLQTELQEAWASSTYKVFVFYVKNISDRTLSLQEPALANKNHLAIWIRDKDLGAANTTKIITIERKERD